MTLRLPKSVESDPRGPRLLRCLTTHTRPLRQGSEIGIPIAGMTREGNDRLYTRTGLDAAFTALRPAGVFALWSASPDRAFGRLLGEVGFEVDEERVRARGSRGGGSHTMWIARRIA